MADARAHEPKLRALTAYAAGELGAESRARLEQHLSACAPCRAALEGRRRYAALVVDAGAADVPDVAWAQIELGIRREAAALRRRARVRALAPVVIAAAAVLAVIVAQQMRAPGMRLDAGAVADRARRAGSEVPTPAAIAVRASAIVGDVRASDRAGAQRALDLDTVLSEGWTLETAEHAEAHLVLGRAAGVILLPESRLRLARTRAGDVLLGLERGGLVNAVQPLAPGERYRVDAMGHQIAVRGTHFSVGIEPAGGLGVQVDEGWVNVLRDGVLIADLRAPRHWQQSPVQPSSPPPGRLALPRPRQPAAGFEAWPVLRVPSWPRVAAWEIGSARISGGAELAMRLPPGGHDIVALLANGRLMRGRVDLDAIGARFDPRGLALVGAQPAAPAVAPDPAQAAAVIRAAQSALQRCYERSTRNGPGGRLAVRLRLEIDAEGHVREADLVGPTELPPVLGDCVRSVARRWRFAAPGGAGIALEAPIRFQPRN